MKVYTCHHCSQEFAARGDIEAHICPFCQTPLKPVVRQIELSICAPMWNEEGMVEEFVKRCARTAAGCTPDFEILIADDGSRDATREKIKQLARHVEHQ